MSDAQPAILPGIEHIVVLMLENRSFDTTLGWLYDGAAPRHFIPAGGRLKFEGLTEAELPKYANPLALPNSEITSYPPVKGATYTVQDKASYLNSPPTDPHEALQYVTDQIYGPLKWTVTPPINPPKGALPHMKGFLQDYVSALPKDKQTHLPSILRVMETYTPDQLPVLCGLARAFACSDMWFSSVPSQTNPNRAFLACGTACGKINNQQPWAYGDYDATTIWNRLDAGQISWKIFWEEVFVPVKDNDNQGWTRKAFPQLRKISNDNDFLNMAEFHRQARNGTLPAFSFIEPSWSLEDREIGQTNGIQGDDFHPPGDVRPGEDLLAQIYTSLLANTQAWEKTLLIITFDEHGGTFDHWPPPKAVPPDGMNQEGFDFDRYGVRVPTIFVSPWIEEQTVIRAGLPGAWPPFDHTSINATVLKWLGQSRSGFQLGKRTEQAPTFENVLNRKRPRTAEELVLGTLRQPPGPPSIRMGDRFYLQYCSPGPYQGWWLSAATYSYSSGTYYPQLLQNQGSAVALSFTLGGVAVPAQTVTHGSLVYITSSENSVQLNPYWEIDAHGYYERSDIYYSADVAPTVPGSSLYWTIKHTDPTLTAVGQPIHFEDFISLQNRYVMSLGDWLPGKLIPSPSKFDSTVYVALTDDPDYTDSGKGVWQIFPAN